MNQQKKLMDQYKELRESFPDSVIFFQRGMFYQLYYYDASLVSETFGMKLLLKKINGHMVPVCGMPVSSSDKYEEILSDAGYKIIVCNRIVREDGNVVRSVHHVVEPETSNKIPYVDLWNKYMEDLPVIISGMTIAADKSVQNISAISKEVSENEMLLQQYEKVLHEIEDLDLSVLTPLRALNLIAEWKQSLIDLDNINV